MRGDGHLIRSTEQAAVIFCVGLAVGVLGPWRVLSYPDASQAFRLAWTAIFVGFGLFGMLRLARCGVRCSDGGVAVVNPFRTRRLHWSEINRFEIRRWGPFPATGSAVLHAGGAVHIWGIQAPNPLTRPRDRSAVVLIDELNGELARSTRLA